MQAQSKHFGVESTLKRTISSIYSSEGLVGFYRGAIPPFFGSCMYRSSQWAIAEGFVQYFEGNNFMMTQIPMTGGI